MKLKIKWFKSGSRLNNLGQAIVSGALQETQSAFNLTSFCNSTKFSWNSISPLGGNSKRNNKHPDFFFFFNSFWEQCWLQYWDWTPVLRLNPSSCVGALGNAGMVQLPPGSCCCPAAQGAGWDSQLGACSSWAGSSGWIGSEVTLLV